MLLKPVMVCMCREGRSCFRPQCGRVILHDAIVTTQLACASYIFIIQCSQRSSYLPSEEVIAVDELSKEPVTVES
jgi:hypothetical protein